MNKFLHGMVQRTCGRGTGNDTLDGGAGTDIYVYNKGDGEDTILETTSGNILRFGAGIGSSDITLKLGSLMLDLGGGDAVHIGNFDQNDVFNSSSVSGFEFADGSTLSTTELLTHGFDLNGTNTTARMRRRIRAAIINSGKATNDAEGRMAA